MYLSIFLLILVLILFFFILGGFWGVIWLPTKKEDYQRIAKLIDLQRGIVFYDLGSGSGNLLFYLAKNYKVKCVGIEISPILYLYSKIKSLFYNNAKIKYGNFFKHDLGEADAIYAFLHPRMYDRLKEKINEGVGKESVLILLSTWPFENVKSLKMSQEGKGTIYYLYKKTDL